MYEEATERFIMAPSYERTELVKTRTSLAHAKNRVQRFLAQSNQAQHEVEALEEKIAKLESDWAEVHAVADRIDAKLDAALTK